MDGTPSPKTEPKDLWLTQAREPVSQEALRTAHLRSRQDSSEADLASFRTVSSQAYP